MVFPARCRVTEFGLVEAREALLPFPFSAILLFFPFIFLRRLFFFFFFFLFFYPQASTSERPFILTQFPWGGGQGDRGFRRPCSSTPRRSGALNGRAVSNLLYSSLVMSETPDRSISPVSGKFLFFIFFWSVPSMMEGDKFPVLRRRCDISFTLRFLSFHSRLPP